MGFCPPPISSHSHSASLANDHSRPEDSLMFGRSPTRSIVTRCSRSNRFACTNKIPSKRSTRYEVSQSITWSRVDWRSFVQRYCKAVIVLKRTNHPNILSIQGVAPNLFQFCMVSQWMPNGEILEYVGKYPGANRLELVSLTHWQSGSALTGL
jgi:hypothetical protein